MTLTLRSSSYPPSGEHRERWDCPDVCPKCLATKGKRYKLDETHLDTDRDVQTGAWYAVGRPVMECPECSWQVFIDPPCND